MAHLFLVVGDFQVTLVENTLTAEEQELVEEGQEEPGDHILIVRETADKEQAEKRVGEVEGLDLVTAWLSLESKLETELSRGLWARAFDGKFMP